MAAYDRLGPLAPDAITVESVTQVGPHHDHGSETTVELSVASLRRVRVEVLAVRRPAAQLTCRAGRDTPATEYRIESFLPENCRQTASLNRFSLSFVDSFWEAATA